MDKSKAIDLIKDSGMAKSYLENGNRMDVVAVDDDTIIIYASGNLFAASKKALERLAWGGDLFDVANIREHVSYTLTADDLMVALAV